MNRPALVILATLLLAASCHAPQTPPAPKTGGANAEQNPASQPAKPTSEADAQRQELAQVPPPAKGRYISITSANMWQNPFIEVGVRSLKVTVLLEDPNPAPEGVGGMMRPAGARRTIQEIRTNELGEMLSDLPATAWPYGRVVAVEESEQDARRDRVQMRRNMEATIQALSNLGVVVDEWNEVGR